MKKTILHIFLILFFCDIGLTKSLLPECKESDSKQWTNCKGTLKFQEDIVYVGEFKNGLREGYGVFTNSDGRKYIGYWKKGLYRKSCQSQGCLVTP